MTQLAQDASKTEFVGTHVDTLTRAELLAVARREDRSVSWVIRRALTAYLERESNDVGGGHE